MSLTFGTPNTKNTLKIMLLGSGELGKEVAIEAQRLGVEVIAVDRYSHAPAMQVAHRHYVIDMQDSIQLRKIIEAEKPTHIVPEIEAITTDLLVELENEGFNIIPTAIATKLTMNRKGIRNLASEELKLKTSPYQFASSYEDYLHAVGEIGLPLVVKPIMSSSGKGQSIIKTQDEIEDAWKYAMEGARGQAQTVIVEGFLAFDYEITLLTVRHISGTSFCQPIGHIQKNGDYRTSWQPKKMPHDVLQKAQDMAEKITSALGGYGLFGVELFIKDNEVYFNEVSPRPHDTGMVTMISQELSEFALHIRAILGLPIPEIKQYSPAASVALLLEGNTTAPAYLGVAEALKIPGTQIRLFGKPDINGSRRMGVVLATGDTIQNAIDKAQHAADEISLTR
jgi:phosphoribosylglycinamide formyltransferase 2